MNAEDDENMILLRKLEKLPSAFFNKLVFIFDSHAAVPGKEAAQSERAIELIKIVRSENRFNDLANEIGKTIEDIKGSRTDELKGILMNPVFEDVCDAIVSYAFIQVRKSVSSDVYSNLDESLVSAVVANLHMLKPAQGDCNDLMLFAVLCHDHAKGIGMEEVAKQLFDWVECSCIGTKFNIDSIRSRLGKQKVGRIHRLAIEIAWQSERCNGNQHPSPEAFYRCGVFREQINLTDPNIDRCKTVADVLGSQQVKKNYYYPIDHVEILLQPEDMHELWEYNNPASADENNPQLHPIPVCLRLDSRINISKDRHCPGDIIKIDDIATVTDADFMELVQDKGVFVGSNNQPLGKLKKAVHHASIALWSRKAPDCNDKLKDVLKNVRIEDVPLRLHKRRESSEVNDIWRHVALLFDPNLPVFQFCNEPYDVDHQHNVNNSIA